MSLARVLPHGVGHFLGQLAIFAGVTVAYEASRAVATGTRADALRHARDVIDAERSLGIYVELDVQRWALDAPRVALDLANWTYFSCQFAITMSFLLWIYLRRTAYWAFARNMMVASYSLGLVGYVLYPTAPPRLLPELGFVDTLATQGVSHQSAGVELLSNPYAAMPSLHTATAILIGFLGVRALRNPVGRALWALYPFVVVYSIVATGNHFLLDAVAGAAVLGLAFLIVLVVQTRLRGRPLIGGYRPLIERR